VIVVFAGIIGVTQLSAQVVIINIVGLCYMIPLGIQYSTSGLVGNEIGKGNTT
jgi:Na+-driven multidrug efflux pump